MALTDNLVNYWKLDESSGDAADSVGAKTLTNVNTATYSAGKINNAVDLIRTSSQYLNHAANIMPTGSITMNAWIKSASDPGAATYRGIVSFFETTDSESNFILWYRNNGTNTGVEIVISSEDNANWDLLPYVITPTIGDWNMVTAVFDDTGNFIAIYWNGVQQGDNLTIAYSPGTPSNFYVGANNVGAGQYFDGSIDEVGIWSRALTSTEITELYNSGNGLQYPFAAITSPFPSHKIP